MFRCQLTGQVSKGAVYGWKEIVNEYSNVPKGKIYTLIEPAEKPVRITILTRDKRYENHFKDEDNKYHSTTSEGTEIVKELVIRECNLELAKKKFNLL